MRLIFADPHQVPDITPRALQILQACEGLPKGELEVELDAPFTTSPAKRILGRPAAPALHFHPVERTQNELFRRSNRWFIRLCRDLLPGIGGGALLVCNPKLADSLLRAGTDTPFLSKCIKRSRRLFAVRTRIRASRNAGNCASSAHVKPGCTWGAQKLALDPGRRRSMGERARARIAREFTWDHVARRLLHELPG